MAIYKGHNEDATGNIILSIGNGITATLESSSTASQSYTKGAYLFFNNRLCKASTNISSGTTLSIGTNLLETSVGEELTSHLRASDGSEFYFDIKDNSYGYYPSAAKVASEFVKFGNEPELLYNSVGAGEYSVPEDYTDDSHFFLVVVSFETAVDSYNNPAKNFHNDTNVPVTVTFDSSNHKVTISATTIWAQGSDLQSTGMLGCQLWGIK